MIIIQLDSEQLSGIIQNSVRKVLSETQANTPQPDSDTLLTIKQAAELINLSVPTLYGLVHKADIPFSKRGNRLYFDRAELIAWIKQGRKKTNAEIATEATEYLQGKKKRG